MVLLPKSLFGRTLLILAAGLLFAQLASLVVNALDRGGSFYRLGAQQMAARIAQTARLVNRLPAEARREAIEVVSSADLTVLISSRRMPIEKGYEEYNPYERAFAATVRRALGRPWRVTVEIANLPRQGEEDEAEPGPRDADAFERLMTRYFYFLLPDDASIVVQVGLEDGSTLAFFARLPQERLSRLQSLVPRLLLWVSILFLLGALLVRMLTRPLRRLAQAADALGADPERPPLEESGPTEVRSVIGAFNRMQAQVRAYVNERTRMLGAISHDLKTPITRMRLRAEMLGDDAVRAKIVRDLADMEAMVGSTLEFFRVLGKEPKREPVDVTALVESIAEDWLETGREVTVAGHPRQAYRGHPEALRRCIENLVDNALRYGTRAHIVIEDSDTELRIRVRDEGPGIPAEDLERVFEPFVRLEASRSRDTGGTGLGLSIARNLARWHGGEVVVSNAAGGGLVAEVRLPRARGAAARTG